jgi:hypothetical protein
MMNLVVFCHDENSPFAQPEDCLSVAKIAASPQSKSTAQPAFRIGARSD